MTKRQSKTGRRTPRRLKRVVSRRKRALATFYIPPDDGTNFVIPGPPDEAGLDMASDHMGIPAVQIKVRRKYVTEAFLKNLPEYDG
jgi:hypothetical protein